MSTQSTSRHHQRRPAVPGGTVDILAKAEADLYAICHELSERIFAAANYLTAASRLHTIAQTAPFVSTSEEALQKALAQIEAAAQTIHELRHVLETKETKDPTGACRERKPRYPAYRVDFFNEFAHAGVVIRACQRTVLIRSARSPDRAVEAAKKRFARIEHIPNWRVHAKIVELEVLGAEADAW